MKFGSFPVSECDGAYLAHSIMVGERRLKKGLRLRSEEISRLLEAGVETVVVAKLEKGDWHEDVAAAHVAEKVAGHNVTCGSAFTGRVNIIADESGVVEIDADKVNAINSINESITLATLNNHAMVTKGQMVATTKIIPLAVPSKGIEILNAVDFSDAVSVRPYQGKVCELIQTELDSVKDTLYDKSAAILKQRIADFGGQLSGEARCPHREDDLAALLMSCTPSSDIILVMGASAITDRQDVIPAAIERAGGYVLHFGMPVDPGNLLLVAKIGDKWVLGLPGCARSPKLNGVDYILARLCAGLHVRSADIMGMGVGGLLSEYVGRPQPRAGKTISHAAKPSIAIAVLAAGQSSRMGSDNKLLLPYQGTTVLGHVLAEVSALGCAQTFVVTGHEAGATREIAEKHNVPAVHNNEYTTGMSTSVKAAVQHVARSCEAVLMVLGDMPGLTREALRTIIASYNPVEGRNLIVPVHDGKRGNPILWGREYFEAFEGLSGDKGAKVLLGKYQQDIHEVEVGTDAIFLDIDTAEAYRDFVAGTR